MVFSFLHAVEAHVFDNLGFFCHSSEHAQNKLDGIDPLRTKFVVWVLINWLFLIDDPFLFACTVMLELHDNNQNFANDGTA